MFVHFGIALIAKKGDQVLKEAVIVDQLNCGDLLSIVEEKRKILMEKVKKVPLFSDAKLLIRFVSAETNELFLEFDFDLTKKISMLSLVSHLM